MKLYKNILLCLLIVGCDDSFTEREDKNDCVAGIVPCRECEQHSGFITNRIFEMSKYLEVKSNTEAMLYSYELAKEIISVEDMDERRRLLRKYIEEINAIIPDPNDKNFLKKIYNYQRMLECCALYAQLLENPEEIFQLVAKCLDSYEAYKTLNKNKFDKRIVVGNIESCKHGLQDWIEKVLLKNIAPFCLSEKRVQFWKEKYDEYH